ncbi:MAG: hypothetical protein KGL99_17295 [Burkholderiales bacterium]|nr:hypothetical protein [Burkholderiales bacterium]MDE2628903.1 hypothetical protein [Burkholderiales bacterium]
MRTASSATATLAALLFRRRQVWLPTLWGWLVLMGMAVLGVVAFAHAAYGWLAPVDPAPGADGLGARTLVVEGWLDETELAQALAAFRRGHYERVLTTGGPIEAWVDVGDWKNYAVRAASTLRAHGITSVPVIAVPAPASRQDRTYLSAVMVRDWAARRQVALGAIDLYSAGVHARRSRLLYRMALGDAVEVGVIAAHPTDFDAEHWWTSSAGAKSTMGETLSLAWTLCCFWPAPHGTFEERWDVPPAHGATP